ncbi:MAG: ATP-dependent RNA helicase HrpA, partial [Pseudonocardia sp.]|nr:ATP-dependent RNA helicase HrpA [Pseudonocardia sp.]
VLRMIALGLGEVAEFPFVDPPDRRAVTDGVNLLHELGALGTETSLRVGQTTQQRKITEVGRSLDRLPIDPRFARMLLEAGRNGCVAEVLVIVAALSIQDPRERPADAQQAADASHARFADPRSDFLSYLNLWRYLADRRGELSGNQFRRMCRAEYLHFLRIREWQDLHGQLRRLLRELDIAVSSRLPEPDAVDQTAVHRSLLAGLLSHIGLQTEPPPSARNNRRRDRNAYLGARNASFAIFPGSGLFRRPPRWVMAAELVETSRLWARTVARIEPDWIEPLATHLVRSTFSEPTWSAKRGAVMARERVTLYGVPIVVDRLTTYTSVDPELCRELFIRHALVQGEWHTNHRFFHRNRELLDEVGEWERRARRRDILVDEQTLFEFYDRRIPRRVASARHFDRWWKGARRETPELLDLTLDSLTHGDGAVSEEEYPSFWSTSTPGTCEPARLAVNYRFEPGAPADGVSVDVPLVTLRQVDEDAFSWQVPGHREELVTALVRSLRKDLRRNFVPVPDTVRAALARMRPGEGNLLDELSRALRELAGVTVPRDAWRLDKVPEHLLVTFRVIGEDGAVLGSGKDLSELRQRFAKRTRAAVSEAAGADLERSGVRAWADIGADELPKVVRRERDGYQIVGYPALVDTGDRDGVAVRVLGSEREQRAAMWPGTRRLLLLAVPSPARQVRRTLSNADTLALSGGPHGSLDALLADCLDAAADTVLASAGGPAWTAAGFDALVAAARTELTGALASVVAAVVPVLTAATEVRSRLDATDARSAGASLGADARSAGASLGADARSAGASLGIRAPGVEPSLADVRDQLAALVHPGFVAATGAARLPDLVRYLRAAARRLETLPRAPERDRDWMVRVHEVRAAYDELLAAVPPDHALDPGVAEIRWMIEELRVSFFAQGLRTRYPVSEKRIYRAIDAQYAR